MHKLCKVASIALSTSLFSTMLTPTVAYADDTIDSATELISATIELAATGVESATYDTALETVLNNISVTGEEVSYEGTVIGYYDTSTPTTLYGDAEKTSPIISQKAEGFIVEPSLLKTLVSDFNDGLIDIYTPTDTTDWSKIIGKYDITFGEGVNGVTIPADQWANTGLGQTSYLNVSKVTGLTLTDTDWSTKKVILIPYTVDSGKLYVCESFYLFTSGTGSMKANVHEFCKSSITTLGNWTAGYHTYTYEEGPYLVAYIASDKSKIKLWPGLAETAALESIAFPYHISQSQYPMSLYNVCDVTDTYAGGFSTSKSGIAWAVCDESALVGTTFEAWVSSVHNNMFDNMRVTKTTVGNATLNARLAKLNGLTMADELTVTHAAWFVGETNIDDFLGETAVMEAGGQADIDTPTEIDPMSFNVIVPSSLPIKVDNLGEVYVADNAVISNYSCAAVTIKSVTITPKPDTGWTMVAEAPSKKRDAKEFTFNTSLTDGIDIGIDENLSFTYSAELSPLTEGTDSLDLVTVSVVVDWADEQTP